MRVLATLMLAFCPLMVHAAVSAPVQQQLCTAAAADNAFGPLMDQLLTDKAVSYQDAAEVLSLDCGKGQFLLGVLVNGMSAENLEYAVIDMGVDVDAPLLKHAGLVLSVSQYLNEVAAKKGSSLAGFATGYLKNFHDPAFNPMLTRVTMN